jgi:hypothetical protein
VCHSPRAIRRRATASDGFLTDSEGRVAPSSRPPHGRWLASDRDSKKEVRAMLDVLMLAMTVVFFAASFGFIRWLDKV